MAFEKVEKDRLTKELILKDILHAAKTYTERKNQYRDDIPLLVCMLVIGTVMILTGDPVWFLLILLPLGIKAGIVIVRKKNTSRLTVDDFTVFSDTANAVEEKVVDTGGKYGHYRTILIMYFDGSGEWEIPYDNYSWSKNWRMSREGVEHTTLQGDAFYIVSRNDTGEIAVAYNQKFFDYQD